MAKKQGFQYKADPFVYQELEDGTSMAIGMDQSDDDKLKVVTQLTPGASPSLGNENIIIDPSANGNIELLPNGTGSIETNSNISFIGGTAGITFDGGTNVLDFYETGTWTPNFAFTNGSVGVEYSVQQGIYTKIGNLVYVCIVINLTSKGSSTGNATITNLPFAANLNVGVQCLTMRAGNITYSGTWLCGSTSASTSNLLVIQQNTSSSAVANITNTGITDNSNFIISGTYIAA